MPRPIPPSPTSITGYRYFLVAMPDDDTAIAAGWDAFSALMNAWEWGLEGITADSETMAQVWADAVFETGRIRDMGFPDDVLTHIDEIEELLRTLKIDACCAPVDVTGGAIYTDTVTDGVGNVPQNIIDAGYATGVSDWTGFAAYKCMIANVTVDTIIRRLREFEALFDSTGDNFLGPFGAVVAVLGFIAASVLTGGAALVVGVIGSLGAATSIYGYLSEFSESQVAAMADAITGDVRDALTCAIVLADGTGDAISRFNAAVDANFTATQALFIKNLNIGPTIRALYAGRYEQQDVAEQLAAQGFVTTGYDCSDCEDPPVQTWSWDWGSEDNGTAGWTFVGGTTMEADRIRLGNATGDQGTASITLPSGVTMLRLTVLAQYNGTAGNSTTVRGSYLVSAVQQDFEDLVWSFADGLVEKSWELDVSAHAGQLITLKIDRISDTAGFLWSMHEGYAEAFE